MQPGGLGGAFGMLGAVVVDQIVVPTLFVMIMGLREKLFGRPKRAHGVELPAPGASGGATTTASH